VKRVDTTSTRQSLWFAFLAGPLAWTAHELVSYVLVRVACSQGLLALEYVVTIAALALTGAGLYVALRAPRSPPQSTPDLILLAALVLNLVFAFAIVMEAIPNVVISPCL
jgi:hypothetical protein